MSTSTNSSVSGIGGAGAAGGGVSNFISLSDAATADIPNINTPTGTALAAKAPLASPTFTGIPAAPSAAVDTNTTQVATTAFVLGQAASATPANPGTAAAGTSTRYARADHVHNQDSAKANVTQTHGLPLSVAGTVSDGRLVKFRAAYNGTITDLYGVTDAGTTVMTLKINGVTVGSTVTAATTEAHGTFNTGNTFTTGQYIEVVLSSTSTCSGLAASLVITRVFAA